MSSNVPAPATTTTQTDTLSTNDSAVLDRVIDDVFSADDSLVQVDNLLAHLDPALGTLLPLMETLLQSLGSYLLGLQYIRAGNFQESRDQLKLSVEGFDQIGQSELRDAAIGFAMYAEAAIEARRGNIGRAQELLKNVREYLRKAGKFGQMFQGIIDHMEPENLFIQAIQALTARDFGNGKALIEQASQASEKLAKNYYEEDTPAYYTFMGMARYYKAVYEVYRSLNNFTELNYDVLASEINLTRDAVQAADLLKKGPTDQPLVKALAVTAEGSVEVLELISHLAPMMQMTLNSTFKPDPKVYEDLRKRIRRANECYAQAGDQAATLLRFCDQLSNQVNNLERLAKPSALKVEAVSLSIKETAAHDTFQRIQTLLIESLDNPLKQLSRWSTLTLGLVCLSVLLVLAGAASAMFLNTTVGVVTSISSVVTSLISSVLYFQLRQARIDVKEARAEVIRQYKESSERFFGESARVPEAKP
jgi:hypothetical protein